MDFLVSSRSRSLGARAAAFGIIASAAALAAPALAASALAAPAARSVAGPSAATGKSPKLGPVKHISADGISIGYRTGGHGPWLIMVIGRGATMAEWDPQLVAQLIRNHHVLVFDNRGVGTTNNTSTKTLTIQQMAHDTLALATALHIKRFDLMGWSMGTFISQEATLDAPKRVRRLVLCATDPGGTHYVQPLPWVEKILTNPKGVTTAQLLALSFPPTKAGLKGAANYIYGIAKQPDLVPDSFTVSAEAQQQQQLATAAWKAPSGGSYNELPMIKQRTIVLWGNLDLPVPPKNDRIVVGRIPNAHGMVFKGAGHAFLFQDPVSVGRTIDKFLS